MGIIMWYGWFLFFWFWGNIDVFYNFGCVVLYGCDELLVVWCWGVFWCLVGSVVSVWLLWLVLLSGFCDVLGSRLVGVIVDVCLLLCCVVMECYWISWLMLCVGLLKGWLVVLGLLWWVILLVCGVVSVFGWLGWCWVMLVVVCKV